MGILSSSAESTTKTIPDMLYQYFFQSGLNFFRPPTSKILILEFFIVIYSQLNPNVGTVETKSPMTIL